jgi:hypothetical protein
MDVNSYEEGDLIRIRDTQAANATISLSEDIEKGIIVRIEHILSGHFVCKKIESAEGEQIKQFPPHAAEDAGEDRKLVDGTDEKVASDVARYLSSQANATSDSLK